MEGNKQKSIRQELMEVQNLILENQYLQDKYPEKAIELELGLKSLKQLEEEMFEALKHEKLNQNLEVFEIHLEGVLVNNGAMPMKEYGEFLINSQDLITSLAEKPLSLNSSPSANIKNDTELDVYAHSSGSLKILLISKQSKLNNDTADTTLTAAFKKLNKISNYEGNISDLSKSENLGKKQVSYFKKMMKDLSGMKLDMEIKKPVKDKPDEILCDIDALKSYKVYKSITEKPKTVEDTKTVTGIIKALDLEKFIFKIESVKGNKKEIITCDFNKNLEDVMVENFNKELTIELKNTTQDFIDKNPSSVYELVEVL